MKPDCFAENVVFPSLNWLQEVSEGKIVATKSAACLLIAIAWQESRILHRLQISGPARSYWQFERDGGVHGVLSHPASSPTIVRVGVELDIPANKATIYEAMAWNDRLACCMARLLLWTDPAALPIAEPSSRDAAWGYYLRNWRPGKPHPQTWQEAWNVALWCVS